MFFHLQSGHESPDVLLGEVCLQLVDAGVEVVGEDEEEGHPPLGEGQLQRPRLQLHRVAQLELQLRPHHRHLHPAHPHVIHAGTRGHVANTR